MEQEYKRLFLASARPRAVRQTVGSNKGSQSSAGGQSSTPKGQREELLRRWRNLIQRVRIHEMLKCLEGEHQKLKIIRDNANLEGLLLETESSSSSSSSDEEPVEEPAKRRGSYKRKSTVDAGSNQQPRKTDDKVPRSKESSAKQSAVSVEASGKAEEREMDAFFLWTIKEEEDQIADIYPTLKSLSDPNHIIKVALHMLATKPHVTDEEFKQLLELCQDQGDEQILLAAWKKKKDREKYLTNSNEKRRMLYDCINHKYFEWFMLATIFLSVVGICLLTFEKISIKYAAALQLLDACIIAIFIVEAVLKLMIYKFMYFRSGWNILDLLIIIVHTVELSVESVTKTLALGAEVDKYMVFKIFKSLRALRLLQIIKFLPNLQTIVRAIFRSMKSMGSTALLMVLFMSVFSVLGRGLFYEQAPESFGTIGYGFITLFQLLTLDDWSELLSDIDLEDDEEGVSGKRYWVMFLYLFLYIVIEYFVFLNIIIAVLADNFQLTITEAEAKRQKKKEAQKEFRLFLEELEREDKQEDSRLDELLKISEYVNTDNMELEVEDYFSTKKGQRENKLLENIYKDLASIDFQRYLWKRRHSVINGVLDKGLEQMVKRRWKTQDVGKLSGRTKEVVEK